MMVMVIIVMFYMTPEVVIVDGMFTPVMMVVFPGMKACFMY